MGATFDSVNYLSAANTIEEGMKKTDGTIFYEWPPLFPTILSLARLIHLDIIFFASILQGLVYSLNLLLTLKILKDYLRHKSLLVFAICCILFSLPLLQVHTIIYSEPIFILLVLLNLIIAKKYLEKKRASYIIWLIIISVLLYLERKSGLYIIVSNSLLILFFQKKNRIAYFFYYIILSLIPAMIWFYRRHEISGKYFGSSGWDGNQLLNIPLDFLHTFSSYFLPSPIPLSIRASIIIMMFVILFYNLIKRHKLSVLIQKDNMLFLSGYYTFSYYIFLCLSLSYVHIVEPIDDRILSPVYLPLIIFIILYIDNLYENIRPINKKFIIVIVSTWLIYPIYRTYYNIERWNSTGTGGYNKIYWHNNSILNNLEKNFPSQNLIITNEVNGLAYHLNYRGKKNKNILTTEYASSNINKGLIVCMNKQWTSLNVLCSLEKWEHKKLVLKNNDGEIWEITHNQK